MTGNAEEEDILSSIFTFILSEQNRDLCIDMPCYIIVDLLFIQVFNDNLNKELLIVNYPHSIQNKITGLSDFSYHFSFGYSVLIAKFSVPFCFNNFISTEQTCRSDFLNILCDIIKN